MMNTFSPKSTTRRHYGGVSRGFVMLMTLGLVLAACTTTVDTAGVFLDASEIETYSTLEELVRASSVVIEGEVISVVPGQVNAVPELEDFAGTQILEVTIATVDRLAGEPVDTVIIEWMGWEIGDDGEPGPPFLVEGMPPPKVGDKAIWFFRERPNPPEGSKATFSIASLDGRLDIQSNGTVTTQIVGPDRLANRLSGTSVGGIKRAVQAVAIP